MTIDEKGHIQIIYSQKHPMWKLFCETSFKTGMDGPCDTLISGFGGLRVLISSPLLDFFIRSFDQAGYFHDALPVPLNKIQLALHQHVLKAAAFVTHKRIL